MVTWAVRVKRFSHRISVGVLFSVRFIYKLLVAIKIMLLVSFQFVQDDFALVFLLYLVFLNYN